MISFDRSIFEKFQQYFQCKKNPGEVESKLWEKAYKYLPPLRFIPGVLFVGVGNSLSMSACHENSDIDLFIITRRNRLWTVRILTTLYFTILGQRKTAKKHAGKFCLSFFITEDTLSFKDIAIENDIYLYFWILLLKPIINKEQSYQKFIEAQENWMVFTEYENLLSENFSYIYYKENNNRLNFSYHQNPVGVWSGDIFETLLKKLFLPKTKKSFQKLGRPFGVIITDNILKFHDNDRREEVRDFLL